MDDSVKGLLSCADCAHAVVNAPGSQAALCNLEAPALAKQHVAGWNADVFENDLRMIMDVAEDAQGADDGHTWCVSWD